MYFRIMSEKSVHVNENRVRVLLCCCFVDVDVVRIINSAMCAYISYDVDMPLSEWMICHDERNSQQKLKQNKSGIWKRSAHVTGVKKKYERVNYRPNINFHLPPSTSWWSLISLLRCVFFWRIKKTIAYTMITLRNFLFFIFQVCEES